MSIITNKNEVRVSWGETTFYFLRTDTEGEFRFGSLCGAPFIVSKEDINSLIKALQKLIR